MNSTIKLVIFIATGISLITSCGKKIEQEPISNDPTVPAIVSDVTVENQPGKAKITYTVPNDRALLYVQAEYVPTSGAPAQRKASFYVDSLIVDGFADTLEHEIKLYSVSRSGVKSNPVTVKVKPQEASIFKIFRSLLIENFFGGFRIKASNPTAENIGIIVLSKNKFNEYEVDNYKSIYTGDADILAKVRGMDTVTQRLGFYVQDRWGNKTDTIFQDITPIYEVKLNKASFKPYVLPGDALQVTNGARLEYAWDERLGWPYTSFTDQTRSGAAPHIITFDMGVAAKLSVIWFRPYPENTPNGQQFYFLTTLKRFEVYGSTSPSASGALDNTWTLLSSYEVKKPSGTAYGKDTDQDRLIASKGWDFEIPLNAPKVRYIRIRCLENWAGGTAQSINELSVYGDPR